MSTPGTYPGGSPVPAGQQPPTRTTVSTMTDPTTYTRSPASGLRPLVAVVAGAALVGSFIVLGWRWSQDAGPALDLLSRCSAGDVACPVQPTIRQHILDPLLLAAGMFALAVGAIVDARRRPVTGLLLAAGSVILGVMVVSG